MRCWRQAGKNCSGGVWDQCVCQCRLCSILAVCGGCCDFEGVNPIS